MSNVERLYKTVPSLMKSFVFGGECGRRYVRRGMAIRAACAARPGCGRWRNVVSRMARHPATGVTDGCLCFRRPYTSNDDMAENESRAAGSAT